MDVLAIFDVMLVVHHNIIISILLTLLLYMTFEQQLIVDVRRWKGEYLSITEDGTFSCVVCGSPLFK